MRGPGLADIEKAEQAPVAVHHFEGEGEKETEVRKGEVTVGAVALDFVFQELLARTGPDVMIAGGPRARAGLQIRPHRSIERRVERSPIAAERVGKESLPVGIAERNETGIFARRLASTQRKIEAALGRVHAEKADGKVAVRSGVYGVAVVHRLAYGGNAVTERRERGICEGAVACAANGSRHVSPRCSDPGAAISVFARRQQASLLQL